MPGTLPGSSGPLHFLTPRFQIRSRRIYVWNHHRRSFAVIISSCRSFPSERNISPWKRRLQSPEPCGMETYQNLCSYYILSTYNNLYSYFFCICYLLSASSGTCSHVFGARYLVNPGSKHQWSAEDARPRGLKVY